MNTVNGKFAVITCRSSLLRNCNWWSDIFLIHFLTCQNFLQTRNYWTYNNLLRICIQINQDKEINKRPITASQLTFCKRWRSDVNWSPQLYDLTLLESFFRGYLFILLKFQKFSDKEIFRKNLQMKIFGISTTLNISE